MIPVVPQPESPNFDDQVRKPGQAFLVVNPNPSSKDFRKKNYWTRAGTELHAAYSGQCAYTTMYLMDSGSVDHFRPKANYPHLAYEWDNYRLARQKINSRKGNTEGVVDPFAVEDGWFILDLPSCLIRPGAGIDPETRTKVNATINIFQLNSDDKLVQERCDLLVSLADEDVTMRFLDIRYPYLSSEVRRQGVEGDLKTLFARP